MPAEFSRGGIAIDGINADSWAGRRPDQRFDDRSTFKQAGLEFLGSLDPLAAALNTAFQTESFGNVATRYTT